MSSRAKVRQYTWDRDSQRFILKAEHPLRKGKTLWFDRAFYAPSLEIASHTGNALLAVVTILRNRNNANGSKPVVLGNLVMKELGFSRRDKIRALRRLESTGFVKVEWRNRQSPLVTVLKKF